MTQGALFEWEASGEVLVVAPRQSIGSLDELKVQVELAEIVAELRATGARHILLDFSRLSYFGSSMLEAMRIMSIRVREREGRLALCGVPPAGRDVLRTARFDKLWPIHADRESALAAIK